MEIYRYRFESVMLIDWNNISIVLHLKGIYLKLKTYGTNNIGKLL